VQITGGRAGLRCASGNRLEAPEGWEVEYLDLILAIRVVPGIEEVLDHLNLYGSHHTDTIVTEDRECRRNLPA
jgi:glutamate-5-semialdehyde dehydrogenase